MIPTQQLYSRVLASAMLSGGSPLAQSTISADILGDVSDPTGASAPYRAPEPRTTLPWTH